MKKTILPFLGFVILSTVTITGCKKSYSKPMNAKVVTPKTFTTTQSTAPSQGQQQSGGTHQCGGGSGSSNNGYHGNGSGS